MSTIPGTIFFSSDTFYFCSIFFFLNKLPYVLILMLTEIKFSNASILLDRFFHSFPPISVKPFPIIMPLFLLFFYFHFSFSHYYSNFLSPSYCYLFFFFILLLPPLPLLMLFFPSSSCKALFYFKSVYEYLYCE